MKENSFSEKELQTVEWVKRAMDDELTARSILKHRDAPPIPVCFFAQQTAEKLLKAFLVHRKHWYPKIHPLDTLWEYCRELDTGFDAIKEECVFLTSFYAATRYPSDTPDYTWSECEKAFEAAMRVKNFVSARLDEESIIPGDIATPEGERGFGMIGIFMLAAFVLLVIGVGYWFFKTQKNDNSNSSAQTACTEEAKVCPDGTSVGRTGPNCEFALCPEVQGATTSAVIDTSDNFGVVSLKSNNAGEWPIESHIILSPEDVKNNEFKIISQLKTTKPAGIENANGFDEKILFDVLVDKREIQPKIGDSVDIKFYFNDDESRRNPSGPRGYEYLEISVAFSRVGGGYGTSFPIYMLGNNVMNFEFADKGNFVGSKILIATIKTSDQINFTHTYEIFLEKFPVK